MFGKLYVGFNDFVSTSEMICGIEDIPIEKILAFIFRDSKKNTPMTQKKYLRIPRVVLLTQKSVAFKEQLLSNTALKKSQQ